MKIINKKFLCDNKEITNSNWFKQIQHETEQAIYSIKWPPLSETFILNPTKKGNGVKPIKDFCMKHLERVGWELEMRLNVIDKRPGPIDAVKEVIDKQYVAFEWETGNISSSHRALNKMAIGILKRNLICGILVLPSRNMYQWLTDRVGNYEELEPYFPLWESLPIKHGLLMIYKVEHDSTSSLVETIKKGTDGRALK